MAVGFVKPSPIAIPCNPVKGPLLSCAYLKNFSAIAGAYLPA